MAKIKGLPAWARVVMETRGKRTIEVIEVDASVVYPAYLERLGFTIVSMYGLEVARRAFTGDLFDCLLAAGRDSLHLRITGGGEHWALRNWPVFDDPERTALFASSLADRGGMANWPAVLDDLETIVRAEFSTHYKKTAPLVDGATLITKFQAAHDAGQPIKLPKHPKIRAACAAYAQA